MYIIGTKNKDGSPNFCIITWLGFSFDNGPCLMMTVGGTKLTKTNILREKKFSANMITEDNLWLADYFGNTNGASIPMTIVTQLKEKVSTSLKLICCGFGVGLSWGSLYFETDENIITSDLVELNDSETSNYVV
jgi:3-hydroxy-3-methylglutaryl CoA synthase